ncbi:unnamed protein product [Peronospora destructor]|uniref:Uncharacterized protein n=1 Tax=Peronospora destructor TaxID=86335 RepID=A0AAV0SU27_9STRA|nr:unnamed protein product [Peronospora destructor]
MLRISLMPDFNRWREKRNTGDMAVCLLGVLVGEILAYCFYRWTDYKCATMKTVIGSFVVSVSVTIYETLALAGRTGQSREQSSQL